MPAPLDALNPHTDGRGGRAVTEDAMTRSKLSLVASLLPPPLGAASRRPAAAAATGNRRGSPQRRPGVQPSAAGPAIPDPVKAGPPGR